MDYDVIFKNVKMKKLATFYTIRYTYNIGDKIDSMDYYRSKDFEDASCILDRVIEELKKNKPENDHIFSVKLMREEFGNNDARAVPLLYANKENGWNIGLSYKADYLG